MISFDKFTLLPKSAGNKFWIFPGLFSMQHTLACGAIAGLNQMSSAFVQKGHPNRASLSALWLWADRLRPLSVVCCTWPPTFVTTKPICGEMQSSYTHFFYFKYGFNNFCFLILLSFIGSQRGSMLFTLSFYNLVVLNREWMNGVM